MTQGVDLEKARFERLRRRIRELPERPGVYLHKSAGGTIIYIGKARDLRARVSSYLVGKGARDAKTMSLVAEIDSIDYVLTSNELEAILLENNLIKTHQPKYNVLLRDDKTYPYLKVTASEDFPRVVFTRRINRRRQDLYFGPFFAGTARRILKLVQDQFRLRSCDLEIHEGRSALPRPCLYYDMHRCPGPCVDGLTSRQRYLQAVDDVVLFLGGKNRELIERLKVRMYDASEEENFELATYYRDLIRTTERILAEQNVASAGGGDADVWGIHVVAGDLAIQVFVLRSGNVVDRREIYLEKSGEDEPGHVLGEVIQRYYQDNLFIPHEILVPIEIEESELVARWLSERRGAKVDLRIPRRGRGAEWMEMAARNAVIAHETRFRQSKEGRLSDAARQLGKALGREDVIRRIESFDISNTQGTDSVAGMIVFDDGRFCRKDYRVFNIRSVDGADDFRSMAEAVERRYRRVLDEGRDLPDLILIDGGRGQLNAAVSALDKLGVEGVAVAGLAKREEEIYLPLVEEPLRLSRRDPALQLLQSVRDETHRFAITSHRRRRKRRTLGSDLDLLDGIGDKRKRLLLEHFGSLASIRQASAQDLTKVLGRKVGRSVYDQLHDTP